jgi:hypothetical protein
LVKFCADAAVTPAHNNAAVTTADKPANAVRNLSMTFPLFGFS